MNKKKDFTFLVFPTSILLIGIILEFLFWISFINIKNNNEIENKLLRASNIVSFLLPNKYHYKGIGPNSHNYSDSIKLFTTMHEYAKQLDVDYIYTMIEKDGNIYYTTLSGSAENLKDDEKAYYWYPLSNAEDSSLEVTKEFFKNPKTIFITNHDKWGTYKSIYTPNYSKDGTLYLIGIDILIKKITYENLKNTLLVGLNFLIFIILILPLLFAFKSIKEKQQDYIYKVDKLKTHDSLTNTYNRNSGLEIINSKIEFFHRYNIDFSIFLIDIKNLNETNKNLGIKKGDKLIKILAAILKNSFRQSDIIIRLGEDEFTIVLSQCNYEESIFFRNKLFEKISIFNSHNKNNYFLMINLAFSEYQGEDLEEFLETSTEKLLFHKKKGSFFDVTFQNNIRKGIENNEFKVYFQPKIDINNNKISFEALLRWKNDKLKSNPDQFIPVAEKSRLILNLTNLVINDVKSIIETYNLEISINISPIIFEKDTYFYNLYDKIKDFDKKYLLIFEITEGVAIKNLNETIKKMKAFKKIGIRFSLDDFGTGYSSLSYLNMLPISEVKIDKSFIKKIKNNEETKIIIEMIVKLGNLLGFRIIAEGVEDLEDIKLLHSLNCHIFQGYYYDKAIPIEEAIQKIKLGFYEKLSNDYLKDIKITK